MKKKKKHRCAFVFIVYVFLRVVSRQTWRLPTSNSHNNSKRASFFCQLFPDAYPLLRLFFLREVKGKWLREQRTKPASTSTIFFVVSTMAQSPVWRPWCVWWVMSVGCRKVAGKLCSNHILSQYNKQQDVGIFHFGRWMKIFWWSSSRANIFLAWYSRFNLTLIIHALAIRVSREPRQYEGQNKKGKQVQERVNKNKMKHYQKRKEQYIVTFRVTIVCSPDDKKVETKKR